MWDVIPKFMITLVKSKNALPEFCQGVFVATL
jgi:hypothetical protein